MKSALGTDFNIIELTQHKRSSTQRKFKVCLLQHRGGNCETRSFRMQFFLQLLDEMCRLVSVVGTLLFDSKRNLLHFSRLLNAKEGRKLAIFTWECAI